MKSIPFILLLFSLGFSQVEGCTDLEAYNCEADSIWSNFIFDIAGTMYDNSCNWDWDLANDEPVYAGGCETFPNELPQCQGYHNPDATLEDGTCRYYQAPHGDNFTLIITGEGIELDWTSFEAPVLSELEYYCIQRCTVEGCFFMAGFEPTDGNANQSAIDITQWEFGLEIKYAIAVKYLTNPYWGWAIDASYITPTAGCTDPESDNYNPEANVDDGSCTLAVINPGLPTNLEIKFLYPNPFNPQLNIEFEISTFQEIHFKVVDLKGRQLENRSLGRFYPGSHQFTWQPHNFNSGMYFISLVTEGTAVSKKVVFLK